MGTKYPKEFLEKLRAITAKRPKIVIDHILKHGRVTTEELKDIYGYAHPPRARMDLVDRGIPVERIKVKAKDGRTIAAYTFGDPSAVRDITHAGRTVFSKKFKKNLLARDGNRCALCSGEFNAGFLQIDHCVPYEVGGQAPGEPDLLDYMLVCRTCNRAKSWSCEHCPNYLKDKNPEICQTCFWGSPGGYTHIATLEVRRLPLTWTGPETEEYDKLSALSHGAAVALPDFVKAILRKSLRPT